MLRSGLAVLTVLALATAVGAEDAYYDVPLGEVEITSGQFTAATTAPSAWQNPLAPFLQPYAVLDGPGEVYVWQPVFGTPRRWREIQLAESHLLAKAPAGEEVRGTLFVPNEQWTGMVAVEFQLPVEAARPQARRSYYQRKVETCAALAQEGGPGAAWFRHQAREARRELGQTGMGLEDVPRQQGERESELEEAYALFSGGRAVAENLQLERQLPVATQPSDLSVDVATLPGITVNQADWQTLLGDAQPKLDVLASAIPADQHALFMPSFTAAMTLADEMGKQALRVLPLAEAGSQDARTLERYEQQLGLSRTGLARLLGPAVVGSVALTGCDPYFRTGTDVAVLFEAKQPVVLEKMLLAQVGMRSQSGGIQPRAGELEVKKADGSMQRVAYTEFRTADRLFCSYVALIGPTVVVTNSPAQLQRLAEVAAGTAENLAGLPEYKFFRSRYVRGEGDETGLVFLSDATIRRWCGPHWRIASARRTMAAAVLAELHAQAAEMLAGRAEGTPLEVPQGAIDVGEVVVGSSVQSSIYGNLDFLTPIAELDLPKATKQEAALYERWREGYQRNWRNFFDPIALRINAAPGRLGLDMTVMPLIASTEYRQFTDLTRGAEISPTAGDPHDAILHVVMALNPQSGPLRQGAGLAMSMAPGVTVDPLGWLGQSVALYLDDDPIWAELPADEDQLGEFMESNWHRLPVALRAEVSSGLKLVAFLTAARGFVEQTSPGMTTWETLQHEGRAYVKVSSPMPTDEDPQASAAVFYFVAPGALTVTLHEDVLKRAMDRWAASTQPSGDGAATAAATHPAEAGAWLGKSLAARLRPQAVRAIERLSRGEYEQALRRASWSNLAALNEWKRLMPQKDLLEVHERLWGVRLVEPAGGQYVWNEQYQTMESTVFGCPAAPKLDAQVPGPMGEFTAADFGLTFENDGLRARVELNRPADSARAP